MPLRNRATQNTCHTENVPFRNTRSTVKFLRWMEIIGECCRPPFHVLSMLTPLTTWDNIESVVSNLNIWNTKLNTRGPVVTLWKLKPMNNNYVNLRFLDSGISIIYCLKFFPFIPDIQTEKRECGHLETRRAVGHWVSWNPFQFFFGLSSTHSLPP